MDTTYLQRSWNKPNRRQLLKGTIAAGAAGLFGPMIVHGQGANETLNLAAVGVGGKGASDLSASAAGNNVRIIGVCDVDSTKLGGATDRYEGARGFRDYRVMLDKLGKGNRRLACLDARPHAWPHRVGGDAARYSRPRSETACS